MPRHALLDRVLAPGASEVLQLACARGSLPLSRALLLPALLTLAHGESEEVRTAAAATLEAITDADGIEAAAAGDAEPEVLEFLLLRPATGRELLDALFAHPALPVRAMARLAAEAAGEPIDLLIANQERLIASPELVDHLLANPGLTPSQSARLADFAEQFRRPGAAPPAGVPAPESASVPGEAGAPAAEPEAPPPDFVSPEELQGLLDEIGDLPFLGVELAGLLESTALVDDELARQIDVDPALTSVWKRLLGLNGVQRLKEALKGDREARGILIRDKNRLVAAAVLKNPRVTDLEIEAFAAQRSLSDDILRMIGTNREWMKSYSILHQLVRNPKTPSGLAMNYIGRLTLRDLQNMSRDRNIAELVRRTARKHIEQRQKPATVGKTGH